MSTEETLRALEHEVGVLVRRVRRALADRARLIHPDLSAVSYSMLGALQSNGPQRASDLVDLFSIDKGAVSRHVQVLLEHGLVERQPDPEDRRAAIISLSAEGRRRMEEVQQVRREKWQAALGDWDEDDLAQFVQGLVHYNSSLE
jgi:DNA-binding MarR family transcriptional regulator